MRVWVSKVPLRTCRYVEMSPEARMMISRAVSTGKTDCPKGVSRGWPVVSATWFSMMP